MLRKRYIVRFLKTVTDNRGNDHECSQDEIEVFAPSSAAAVDQAKTEFCQKAMLTDWQVHADRFEVSELEYAS